jgi:hypothetical protein
MRADVWRQANGIHTNAPTHRFRSIGLGGGRARLFQTARRGPSVAAFAASTIASDEPHARQSRSLNTFSPAAFPRARQAWLRARHGATVGSSIVAFTPELRNKFPNRRLESTEALRTTERTGYFKVLLERAKGCGSDTYNGLSDAQCFSGSMSCSSESTSDSHSSSPITAE